MGQKTSDSQKRQNDEKSPFPDSLVRVTTTWWRVADQSFDFRSPNFPLLFASSNKLMLLLLCPYEILWVKKKKRIYRKFSVVLRDATLRAWRIADRQTTRIWRRHQAQHIKTVPRRLCSIAIVFILSKFCACEISQHHFFLPIQIFTARAPDVSSKVTRRLSPLFTKWFRLRGAH